MQLDAVMVSPGNKKLLQHTGHDALYVLDLFGINKRRNTVSSKACTVDQTKTRAPPTENKKEKKTQEQNRGNLCKCSAKKTQQGALSTKDGGDGKVKRFSSAAACLEKSLKTDFPHRYRGKNDCQKQKHRKQIYIENVLGFICYTMNRF